MKTLTKLTQARIAQPDSWVNPNRQITSKTLNGIKFLSNPTREPTPRSARLPEQEAAVLLVDSLALKPLQGYLQSQIHLHALSVIEQRFDVRLVRKEMFCSRYQDSLPQLRHWAESNRWRLTETDTSTNPQSRISNAPDIGATIVGILLQKSIKHLFVLANDLALEPLFRLAHGRGMTIRLIYVDDEEFHAYSSLIGNVDEVIDPADLPGVLDEGALPRENEAPILAKGAALGALATTVMDSMVDLAVDLASAVPLSLITG